MITVDEFVVGDDPDAWRAAGFAVVGDVVTIGSVRIRCAADDGGSDRWTLRSTGSDRPADIDGLATAWSESELPEPVAHPNGITDFDHVVVRSPDLDRTTAALEALGVSCRRIRDFQMGDTAAQQRFFRLGSLILEMAGVAEPVGTGPASIWGFAVVSPDLAATVDHLGPACGRAKDAVQPGRQIATLRTRDLGISTPIAIMSPHVRP